jgi:hypothetical protein
MKTLALSILAMGALLLAPPASAIQPLGATELKEVCADQESRLCVFYVKGFLDGAVATDSRVARNVAAEVDGKESFSERAIRTRVISRINTYGPTVYAKFCVGQPDPIAEVVQHVVEELERYDSLESVQAQSVVYASLRRHYACAEVDEVS